jgi:hypothetical protein
LKFLSPEEEKFVAVEAARILDLEQVHASSRQDLGKLDRDPATCTVRELAGDRTAEFPLDSPAVYDDARP